MTRCNAITKHNKQCKNTTLEGDTCRIHSNECSICHNIVKQKISLTNCKHEFCIKCLQQWIDIKKICPYCRTNVSEIDIEKCYRYQLDNEVHVTVHAYTYDLSEIDSTYLNETYFNRYDLDYHLSNRTFMHIKNQIDDDPVAKRMFSMANVSRRTVIRFGEDDSPLYQVIM